MIAYYNQKSNLVFDDNFPIGSTVYDPEAEKIGIVIDNTGVKYFGEEEAPAEAVVVPEEPKEETVVEEEEEVVTEDEIEEETTEEE